MPKILFSVLTVIAFSVTFPTHATKTTMEKFIPMEVTDKGFTPKSINVNAGENITLQITRKTDATCSTSILVPDKKINVQLPKDQKVDVKLGTLAKGTIKFGCGMNMMDSGRIIIN